MKAHFIGHSSARIAFSNVLTNTFQNENKNFPADFACHMKPMNYLQPNKRKHINILYIYYNRTTVLAHLCVSTKTLQYRRKMDRSFSPALSQPQ